MGLGELLSTVAVTVYYDRARPAAWGSTQGVPLTWWSSFYASALPDRITIYRHAICALGPRTQGHDGAPLQRL